MKNRLLIPNRYKVFGWIIFLLFSIVHLSYVAIYSIFKDMDEPPILKKWSLMYNIGDAYMTIIGAFILIGLMLICFSKEKNEDEYISYLRLKSWQLSVLISYGILFVANLFIYEGAFFSFMIYNMLTVPLVFIVIFNLSLYKLKRERLVDEK